MEGKAFETTRVTLTIRGGGRARRERGGGGIQDTFLLDRNL